jgi:hypothetical protein
MTAVLVAEMRDASPPVGVAAPQQIRDWLAAALEGGSIR